MRQSNSPWVVIQVAHSQARAEAAQGLLIREGFMVKIRPVNKALSTGGVCLYEIMALTSEAEEARDLLQENGF